MNSSTYLHVNPDEILTNARVRFLPDDNGVYQPYELLAFPRNTFVPDGWESSFGTPSKKVDCHDLVLNSICDAIENSEVSRLENRRKSFNRARNNLFNIALSTLSFDCFVTLTFDGNLIDRYSYDDIIKKLSYWLDNRVRRNGLTYVLVPEYHKDKAVHFHGLCNFDALKTTPARSPYTGKLIYDDKGRKVYNISDFKLGYSTAIPLSGDNARTATAKYCYKYITKSQGKMVGGRYYLSGGDLGRPKYKLIQVNYDALPCDPIKVGGIAEIKKLKLNGVDYSQFMV